MRRRWTVFGLISFGTVVLCPLVVVVGVRERRVSLVGCCEGHRFDGAVRGGNSRHQRCVRSVDVPRTATRHPHNNGSEWVATVSDSLVATIPTAPAHSPPSWWHPLFSFPPPTTNHSSVSRIDQNDEHNPAHPPSTPMHVYISIMTNTHLFN
eukprot:scaffold142078_cov63-Attheya_sp.AAC.1